MNQEGIIATIIILVLFTAIYLIIKYKGKTKPKEVDIFIHTPHFDIGVYEIEMVSLVNLYRNKLNLTSLELDLDHYNLAKKRTKYFDDEDMRRNLSHSQLIKHSEELRDKEGIDVISENIAYGYTSVESCFDAWVRSADHVSNILKHDWKYTAVSIKENVDGEFYFCQIFGK